METGQPGHLQRVSQEHHGCLTAQNSLLSPGWSPDVLLALNRTPCSPADGMATVSDSEPGNGREAVSFSAQPFPQSCGSEGLAARAWAQS